MIKKIFSLLFCIAFTLLANAQELEKKWQLKTADSDYLELNEKGTYKLQITTDSLYQKGDYLVQDNFLFLFENGSDSPTKRFIIETKTDSTLTLKKGNKAYSFFTSNKIKENKNTSQAHLIPAKGKLTLNNVLRGILGMVSLIIIAFLFSSNRKAINWQTVGIGLLAQLLLAIGILKVSFVQAFFDFVGKLFTQVLEFTRAGSEFLLGGMMDIQSFGCIFLFQVFPTIIFFLW